VYNNISPPGGGYIPSIHYINITS